MKTADIQLFRIIGHTDASGSDDYNERLSRLRAEEVQRFFVNDCGIEASRLEAVGLGERFLLENVDPNSDQNRRVEFQALS
jgi:OOP family OmpA-OmpF porin